MKTEATRLQHAIDEMVDSRVPVCVLNPDAGAQALAAAAMARAEYLDGMAEALQLMTTENILQPYDVALMFAPVAKDLAVITGALVRKLASERGSAPEPTA